MMKFERRAPTMIIVNNQPKISNPYFLSHSPESS